MTKKKTKRKKKLTNTKLDVDAQVELDARCKATVEAGYKEEARKNWKEAK